MPAGRQKFVTINVATLEERFAAGEVVDLALLKERGVINATGKERKLPLKVNECVFGGGGSTIFRCLVRES